MWMQPPKAGPVRTSSDPPDCPPSHLSHTPSQNLTTIRIPVPPRVWKQRHFTEFRVAQCAAFFPLSTDPNTDTEVQLPFVTLCCHIYSLSQSLTALHSELYIHTRRSLLSVFSLSLSDAEKTLLDRRRWRELESRSSKSKCFIIFLFRSFFNIWSKKEPPPQKHPWIILFLWYVALNCPLLCFICCSLHLAFAVH